MRVQIQIYRTWFLFSDRHLRIPGFRFRFCFSLWINKINQLLESKHNWSFIEKYKQIIKFVKLTTQNCSLIVKSTKLITYWEVYKIAQLLRTAQNCSLIGKSTKLFTLWKLHKIVHLLESLKNCSIIGKYIKLLTYWKISQNCSLKVKNTKLLTYW